LLRKKSNVLPLDEKSFFVYYYYFYYFVITWHILP
jgi:hypothetical protein